jgi:hypothetical protein
MFTPEDVPGRVRAAVEALRGDDLADQPDGQVEEDFAELQRLGEALELERLRRLADLDRRCAYVDDGYLSTASWLAGTHRMGWPQAREQVRTARALSQMERTRSAVEAGQILLPSARVMIDARRVDPEAFSRCEDELVEAARIHTVRDLQRAVGHFRQACERLAGFATTDGIIASSIAGTGSRWRWTAATRCSPRRVDRCSRTTALHSTRASPGPRPGGAPDHRSVALQSSAIGQLGLLLLAAT